MASQNGHMADQRTIRQWIWPRETEPTFPTFLSSVSLLVVALGYGLKFACLWSGGAFYMAAVLIVDDSDLFHLARPNKIEEEFLIGSKRRPLIGGCGTGDSVYAGTFPK